MILSSVLLLLPFVWSIVNGEMSDFYSFTVEDINGDDFNLEQYRGTVSLVVNVASECGYTDTHYKALTRLHDELSPTGKFQVLAFPCNQFGAQEPGKNQDILKFTQKHYGVTFPIFGKIDVIGDNLNPAFASLIGQSDKAPNWNFWKYLVDTDGEVVGAWGPQQSVESIEEIVRRTVAVASNLILEPGSDEKRIHPELLFHIPYWTMAQIKTDLMDYKDEKTGQIFQAYVAYDQSKPGPKPVVLVCHAIHGRTDHENDKAVKLAQLGYVGFAVDLYGKGVAGSSLDENRKFMQALLDDRNGTLLGRLKLSLDTAKKLPYVDSKKVAAIGYCFGGLCVLDMARNGLGTLGVVSFHGRLSAPAQSDKSNSKITSKVLALHGHADPYVPQEQVNEFTKEMTECGSDWQLHAYGQAMHSFTDHLATGEMKGVKYEANADRRSWESMKYFLTECFA